MITVVTLTKNEEKNIAAAITSAKKVASRIVVLDSGSTDRTVEIAKELGADVYFREWDGYAPQFNYALDSCNITTPWVFRLDADERISDQLAEEIKAKLPNSTVDGYSMRWRIYFMGKWIRHGGTHKTYFLRLFRHGKGRVANLIMDEHTVVEGLVEKLSGDLIHYDYKGLDPWLAKHVWYAGREADMALKQMGVDWGNKAQRRKRGLYYRFPLFLRAKLYFWFRYWIQLGFLDGTEGKIFCFLQAYWYRFLVDAKIYEKENGDAE